MRSRIELWRDRAGERPRRPGTEDGGRPLRRPLHSRPDVLSSVFLCFVGLVACGGNGAQDASVARGETSSSRGMLSEVAACRSFTPASIGGPLPDEPDVVTLRWLGTANYELAYRDQVFLLDAFYERGPGHRPLGFTRDEVTRADAILIGHGHWDHISDAPYLARRTGATVVGASTAIEYVREEGLEAERTRTVEGGERFDFGGVTIEAVAARHADFAPERYDRSAEAYELLVGPAERSEDERARAEEIRDRGSDDPAVRTEGTIAYLFHFENGVRIAWTDTPGRVSPQEREALERVGGVDVALLAYQGPVSSAELVEWVLPKVRLYRPSLLLPSHHDLLDPVVVDAALTPFFIAVRDALPETRTVAPLYREPICVHTETGELRRGSGEWRSSAPWDP